MSIASNLSFLESSTGTVVVPSTSGTNSTLTGALTVAGGVGVGGGLYVGGTVFAGLRADATASATSIAVYYNPITKEITTATVGTGASTFNGGTVTSATTFSSTVTITSTAIAGSTNTGALQVAGGAGIGGSLYVGGGLNVSGIITATQLVIQYTTITQTIVVSSDVFTITNSTVASSTITGALVVAGGVGIGGSLYVGGTINGTVATATAAINIAGGGLGQIPIQSGAGTTAFISSGTTGQILQWSGNTATWVSTGSLTAGIASTANNISGGLAGFIHIQSAPGITSFITTGSVGTLLQMQTNNTATWVSTSSLVVSSATNLVGGTANQIVVQSGAGATTFVGPGTAGQILQSNSPGLPSYVAQTTLSVGTATNIASGAAGSLVIQSGAGQTTMLPIGLVGTILQSNGTTATWVSTGSLTAGIANSATNITGGQAGFIHIQSAPGITSFITTGSVGTLLQMQTNNTASFVSTTTLLVNAAVTATSAATAYSLANTSTTQVGYSATANNLAGGAAGSLVIQSGAGQTTMLPIGLVGTILQSNGTTATWVSTSSLTAGIASTATNIAGGVIGLIPIQSSAGTTAFIATGSVGTLLQMQTNNTASFVSTSTLQVGYAVNATTATSAAVAYSLATTSTLLVGSANNIAGGVIGLIPIQSSAGTTAFIATGTTGQILQWSGTTATWVSTGSLTAGIASSATTLATVLQTTNATYYPTFVNANPASTTYLSHYTTSSFSINPSTGYVAITNTPLATSTYSGLLQVGTLLNFSDTNVLSSFVQNINGYTQMVLQNTNGGTSASADFIVNNSASGTTIYGDFGINGTAYSGVDPFSDPSGTYLYAAGGTLAIGTTAANNFRIATNNTTRITIDSGGNAVITGITTVSNTTNASSTITGALVVSGGLGVGGNLYVGGAIYGLTNVTGVITTATSIANGTAGQIPIQSGIGVTSFIPTGTAGYLLQYQIGNTATWVNTATFLVNSANNIAGGAAGGIHYQSAAGVTGFIPAVTVGQVLVSNGSSSAPSYNATSTFLVGSANNIAGGTVGAIPIQSGGSGVTTFISSGTTGQILQWSGGTAVWANTGTFSAGISTTATNLAGGASGWIPIQSGAGSTIFITSGTVGTVLVMGVNTATWQNTLTLTSIVASNSTNSGALQVAGGVGIGGNLYVGGNTNVTGNVTATNMFVGPWPVSTGLSVASVANALTINNSGAGVASGSTYNGSSATTISYNTLGAPSASGANATGTWNIVVGTAATATSAGTAYALANTSTTFVGFAGYAYTFNTSTLVSNAVSATNALNVGTVLQTGNATYYPTFVNTNPASITYLAHYTTSSFSINPSTGLFNASLINVSSTASSTSTTTGALTVAGGVGIQGNLYVGGSLVVSGNSAITSDTSGNVKLTGTATSTSTTTGALQVAGGVGIGGNLFAGGTVYSNGIALLPTVIQEFSATAGQTVFTITGGYTVGSVQVFANGVALGNGDFTATNGTTVTLSVARTLGDVIRITSSAVSVNSVTTSAVTILGGTAGQIAYQTAAGVTGFTGPGTAGQILISQGTSAPLYQSTLTVAGSTVNVNGNLSVTGNLVNPIFQGYTEVVVVQTATSAATIINLAASNIVNLTLNTSTTIGFINTASVNLADSIMIVATQSATAGSNIITWPSSVKWPNASAPTLSTSTSSIDVLNLITINGGITFFGALSLANVK